MNQDLHHASGRIIIYRAVLNGLRRMTPVALKTYLYMCGRYEGAPSGPGRTRGRRFSLRRTSVRVGLESSFKSRLTTRFTLGFSTREV